MKSDIAMNLRKKWALNPAYRAGPAAFNTLLEVHPDFAELIRATDFDPFYANVGDERYQRFMKLVFMIQWP